VEAVCHTLDCLHVTRPGSLLNVPSTSSDLVFGPPMLATLVRTLPVGPEWEYEVKLDGYAHSFCLIAGAPAKTGT
jgi:hypothetical protein